MYIQHIQKKGETAVQKIICKNQKQHQKKTIEARM